MDNYERYIDTLEDYWSDIPVGRENAVDYRYLSAIWGYSERGVRNILHELSIFDNGDDYILIRSSKGKGFYKSNDPDEIKAFKAECLKKGRSVFAPVRKINRVLNNNSEQFSFENNLRTVREMKGYKQTDVCDYLRKCGQAVDAPLLSKMENGACFPTPFQLWLLSALYEVPETDLIKGRMFETR